jgi:solute carrier family 30 (zinc transporter), member 2
VLGALASVLSIWLVTGILVYEAIDRVVNPVRVNGKGARTGAAVLQPSSKAMLLLLITQRDAPAHDPSHSLPIATPAPAVMFFLALAGCGVNLVNLFVLDSHVGHSHGPGEGHGCGGHGHSHGSGEPEHDHSHSMQGAPPRQLLQNAMLPPGSLCC